MNIIYKYSLLVAFCISSNLYSQLNITYKSKLPFPGKQLSNLWGYTDSLGREFALVGHSTGMTIVDVTDPTTPASLFTVPGPNSTWREVRTKDKYAFVTTEGGQGLKIVNLSYLPDSIQTKNYTGDGTIAGMIDNIHALHVDGNYLYLYGASDIGEGGALMLDVTNPWNPVFKGDFQDWYVHDGIVRNDTAYFAHISDGFFTVVNTANKANPVLMASQNTPGNFSHNTWLSDDSKTLFTTDEKDNAYVAAYDVTDLGNIKELDRIQHNPGTNSVPHNTYILNDYAVTSWYKDGVVIIDAHKPDNLVITGHYDTSPMSGGGMDGCWGVYCYFPSGNIIASDMQEGLFVLAPDYKRACYLEGTVTEKGTGTKLNNVFIEILSVSVNDYSKPTGDYKMGYAIPGAYSVKFSKAGYVSKTITGVNLISSQVTLLDVELDKAVAFSVSGQVLTADSGNGVAGANVIISNSLGTYTATTNSSGSFTINNFYEDDYDIIAGKWGYKTQCISMQNIAPGTASITIQLEKGIYDDFTFNFGWSVSGDASAGEWERGKPNGTTNNNQFSNPNEDVQGDCSDKAFVTGNSTSGGVGGDDVDDGVTILSSPVFNPSSMTAPFANFYTWFYNAGGFGTPNDWMRVKLYNGTDTVQVLNITAANTQMSKWNFQSINIKNFISVSATMKIIVEVADVPQGNLTEGGFDWFEVIDSATIGISETDINAFLLNAFPNPFSGEININYTVPSINSGKYSVIVSDITGRLIERKNLTTDNGKIVFGNNYESGMYFVSLVYEENPVKTIKIVCR